MKVFSALLIQIIMPFLFLSCNNSPSKHDDTKNKTAIPADPIKVHVENRTASDSSKENTMDLTAMFVEFTLGDASHFVFKDKSGKDWDFAENKDTHFGFAVEVPKNKVNEKNQGWASNKALQGKWFDIKYMYITQTEYPDGPMAKVPVIIEAKMQQ